MVSPEYRFFKENITKRKQSSSIVNSIHMNKRNIH
jgi:hypothetical protein